MGNIVHTFKIAQYESLCIFVSLWNVTLRIEPFAHLNAIQQVGAGTVACM